MLDLGKYATPILLSYGAAILLMGGLILASIKRQRRIRQQIRRIEEESK